MKPPPFDYCAPHSLEEALERLANADADGETKVLAGGQSLIPAMNFRLARPTQLIDLNGVHDLDGIEAVDAGQTVRIGALTRQSVVEKSQLVARQVPLLHQTMPQIAHPQIRNRGTFGGSLAHADPAAELPAVCLALDARFHLRSQSSQRTVPATEFFVGLFATDLAPDEILTAIDVPTTGEREGSAFLEIARRSGDYALCGVAARIALDESGRCSLARLSFLSVDDTPLRASQAEQMLQGEELADDSSAHELIAQAAAHAAEREIDPGSDIHASAAFRRHLARGLAEKALRAALEQARTA